MDWLALWVGTVALIVGLGFGIWFGLIIAVRSMTMMARQHMQAQQEVAREVLDKMGVPRAKV